jgi:hypothetical protein
VCHDAGCLNIEVLTHASAHAQAIHLRPYRVNVPWAAPLGVPNPDAIPPNQKLSNFSLVKFLFRVVIKYADKYWPQVRAPAVCKPCSASMDRHYSRGLHRGFRLPPSPFQARADEPLQYKSRIRTDVGADYYMPR